jgi:hypothetical protein
MTILKKITEKVRAINDPCGECEGEGYIQPIKNNKGSQMTCRSCKGKGYVQELEFGTMIKGKTSYIDEDKYGNLEKKWREYFGIVTMVERHTHSEEIIGVKIIEQDGFWYDKEGIDIDFIDNSSIGIDSDYNIRYIDMDNIIENLGKPLDGMELLLALSKEYTGYQKHVYFEDNFIGFTFTNDEHMELNFEIPLNKKPSEYDEVLLDQLDEIL